MRLLYLVSFFSIFFSPILLKAEDLNKNSSIRLTSEGRINIPADQVEITLQVITDKQDAESALLENNEKMEKVFNSLKEIGLDTNEYQTGGFNISPIYTQPPKEYDSSWVSKIDHYRVTNTIVIKTQKLALSGQIIDAALNSGANNLNNLTFNLKADRPYRARLIKNAIQNALKDASTIAEELNQKIIKVKKIIFNDATNPNPVYGPMLFKSANGTPLQAGNVELTASITVIFDIEPKD